MTEEGKVQANGVAYQKPNKNEWFGIHTVWGKDGETRSPMVTRAWIGRLRLHIFWRGDNDPDCHDHPWPFWTFPLTPYVEEFVLAGIVGLIHDGHSEWTDKDHHGVTRNSTEIEYRAIRIVPAWRWSFRRATYTHRVLGRYSGVSWYRMKSGVGRPDIQMKLNLSAHRFANNRGIVPPSITPDISPKPIITIVWRGRKEREWGFLKNREGKWCWVAWKEYVYGKGKSAPCE